MAKRDWMLRTTTQLAAALMLFAVLFMSCTARAQSLAVVNAQSGLTLQVADDYACPTLRVLLPAASRENGGSPLIVYPEHVTVAGTGGDKAWTKHLYTWWPPEHCVRPAWRKDGNALEYEMDLPDGVHLLARATLEADGVRYLIRLTNASDRAYDQVHAVWDPRMNASVFRDTRLERTFVHRKEGWQLLAVDTPQRLTMPLNQWLPNRYMDAYTWPAPPADKREVKDEDGIVHYDAAERVDLPVIAALSEDRKWVAASSTGETGNVWTNPELNCQHANPSAPLPAHGEAILTGKTFFFPGTLDDLLPRLREKQ